MVYIILINILGLILINLFSSSRENILDSSRIVYWKNLIGTKYREIGIGVSIISLYMLLWEMIKYNENNLEYQIREDFLGFNLGIDGVAISLIILISIIEPILIILIKGETKEDRERISILNYLLILKIFLLILFSTLDLFLFFISFELLLIPMFILISRYGSQYQFFLPRLEAGIRFFLYTLIGSLLMLIGIITIYIIYGTTSNEILNLKISNSFYSIFNLPNSNTIDIRIILGTIWILLFFTFMIKIPIFPFHVWLPLAHSEAPTIGSIILAAILLKLGTYGILRYSIYIYSPSILINNIDIGYEQFIPLVYLLALISIYYCSILAIRGLYDIKKIIAYSSIVHMNFAIFGLFSKDIIGLIGSSFLNLTHAFISSGLFLLIGLIYKRFHTRFLFYYQGFSSFLPIFSTFFFLFSLANISLPFCSSFLSEFFILISSFHSNPFISLLLSISLLFSSSFFLWFTIRLLFGSPSSYIFPSPSPTISNINIVGAKDITLNEFISLVPLLFFTIYFTFFPSSLISLFSLPLLLLI